MFYRFEYMPLRPLTCKEVNYRDEYTIFTDPKAMGAKKVRWQRGQVIKEETVSFNHVNELDEWLKEEVRPMLKEYHATCNAMGWEYELVNVDDVVYNGVAGESGINHLLTTIDRYQDPAKYLK